MFDSLVASTAGTRRASAVQAWSRVENAACAQRIAAMVDTLDAALSADGSADRERWYLDNWGAVTAQIGAVQRITPRAADRMLLIGVALRERLPRVAALFAAGEISYALVKTAVIRSALVTDPDAQRQLDALLAAALAEWEPLSVDKTDKAIDAIIAQVDPLAQRRTQHKARDRHVDIVLDDDGMATLRGTLFAHDAAVLDKRLNALADTVCPADPRTTDQRRADAHGLPQGADRLPCLCQNPDCPAATQPPASAVVVYVVAHQDTVTDSPNGSTDLGAPGSPGTPSPAGTDKPDEPTDVDDVTDSDPDPTEPSDLADSLDGVDGVDDATDPEPEPPAGVGTDPDASAALAEVHHDLAPTTPTNATPDPTPTATIHPIAECASLDGNPSTVFNDSWHEWHEVNWAELTSDPPSALRPGYLMGGRALPATVSQRAAMNATLVPILHPGQAPPENRYTPSKKLADFVRTRDLTCRFPGCRHPATDCDLDHTIPYPYGPTCASNLKCLCRFNHLLKPSGADRTDGATSSTPTGRWNGSLRTAALTPPPRVADRCSPNSANPPHPSK